MRYTKRLLISKPIIHFEKTKFKKEIKFKDGQKKFQVAYVK